jgi:mono/diheme cytochrome c family protein
MRRLRRLWPLLAGSVLLAVICARSSSPGKEPTAVAADDGPKLAEQFRKPVALAWVEPSKLVAVANGRSGTISLVDIAARRVVGETKIAERLSDLAQPLNFGTVADHPEFYVALDDKTHELLYLKIKPPAVEIVGRLRLSDDPRRVIVAGDERTAVVSCGWSRRVDIVELRPDDESRDPANWNRAFPRLLRSVPLSFAPQELLLTTSGGDSADGRLLVVAADAFGGRLAIIDVEKGVVVVEHELDGRNIRGLSYGGELKEMLVAYQRADEKQPTTEANLRAGKLVANLVARIPFSRLTLATNDVKRLEIDERDLKQLDVDSSDGTMLGAADPDDITVSTHAGILVLLAGTGQLASFRFDHDTVSRVDVGARPTALLLGPHGWVVANSLDDTLSLIEETPATVSLGPRPELWPRDRGERLFFDGRRSLGGLMSCHSCHTDGHTSGDLADTLGDDTYGTPKRIPTLLGSSITDPWGWNGGLRELRDQVERSFRTSMHDPRYRPQDSDDVTAFLHTLTFPPPLHPKPRDADDQRLVAAGRAIFERRHCADCHVAPLTFTSPAVYDVGVRDEKGLAKFNPPSLRGVGHGTTFFHDGRRNSLDDLFRLDRHSLDDELTAEDLRALVRYLQGL